jgi:hypothetical protein
LLPARFHTTGYRRRGEGKGSEGKGGAKVTSDSFVTTYIGEALKALVLHHVILRAISQHGPGDGVMQQIRDIRPSTAAVASAAHVEREREPVAVLNDSDWWPSRCQTAAAGLYEKGRGRAAERASDNDFYSRAETAIDRDGDGREG